VISSWIPLPAFALDSAAGVHPGLRILPGRLCSRAQLSAFALDSTTDDHSGFHKRRSPWTSPLPAFTLDSGLYQAGFCLCFDVHWPGLQHFLALLCSALQRHVQLLSSKRNSLIPAQK